MAQLDRNTDFIVGEEKVLDYVVSGLFFIIFFVCLYFTYDGGFQSANVASYIFVLALLPAFVYLFKARSNRIYIRINKTGIYQDEQLVTTWGHFIKAYLSQQPKTFSIQDNFILVVEYTREDPKKGFRRKIPLSNTQNKSEEDVLAAVRFFWNDYKLYGSHFR